MIQNNKTFEQNIIVVLSVFEKLFRGVTVKGARFHGVLNCIGHCPFPLTQLVQLDGFWFTSNHIIYRNGGECEHGDQDTVICKPSLSPARYNNYYTTTPINDNNNLSDNSAKQTDNIEY